MSEAFDDALAGLDKMVESLEKCRKDKMAALLQEVQALGTLEAALTPLEEQATKLQQSRMGVAGTDFQVQWQIGDLLADIRSLRFGFTGFLSTVGNEFGEVARLARRLCEIHRKRAKVETASARGEQENDVTFHLRNLESELNFTVKGSEEWLRDVDPIADAMRELDCDVKEQRAKMDSLLWLMAVSKVQ